MKKYIAFALAMLLSLTAGALAEEAGSKTETLTEADAEATVETMIEYKIDESYTVTLPDTDGTIFVDAETGAMGFLEFSNLRLIPGTTLQVWVESENDFVAKLDEDNGIEYTLKVQRQNIIKEVSSNGEAAAAPIVTIKAAGEYAYSLHMVLGTFSVKYAGNYTDSLTFRVAMGSLGES